LTVLDPPANAKIRSRLHRTRRHPLRRPGVDLLLESLPPVSGRPACGPHGAAGHVPRPT
jgi:hypothetical protein